MVLIVDEQRDEIRQYAPESDWIVNAFAYVGGLPKEKTFTGVPRKQFRGCMRKVGTRERKRKREREKRGERRERKRERARERRRDENKIFQVKYEADAQEILFVNLADQGFGDSVIRTGGELAFSCKNPQVGGLSLYLPPLFLSLERLCFQLPPDILSFNTPSSFLTLPKWNSMASGSIGETTSTTFIPLSAFCIY